MRLLLAAPLLLLAACASAPPVQTAPQEVQGAIVLVDEPNITGSQDSFAQRNNLADRVHRHVESSLQERNLRIVTDPSAPHHLRARTTVTVESGPSVLPVDKHITVEVDLIDGAEVIARGSSGRKSVRNDLQDRSFGYVPLDYLAPLATNDLFSRPVAWNGGEPRTAPVAAAAPEPSQATPEPVPDTSSADQFLSATPQPRSYALIIGVEDYRDLPAPTGARRDAERFRDLLTDSMGVPERNVRFLTDANATRGDILTQLRWLEDNVSSGGRIYFYFAGHGSPETSDGTSFLLPYEASLEGLEYTGISLGEILSRLETIGSREVVAFVDACFSGTGGRSLLPEGTRPLVPVETPEAPARVALFSASGANQISGNRPDDNTVGLFTHHLIEALGSGRADIDGDGQISLAELATYVTPRVENEARQASREQTPTLILSEDLGDPEDVVITWGISAD